MPMNKLNAREKLANICDQFHKITGERIGVVFTWGDGLTIHGPPGFKQFISKHRDEVWEGLAYSTMAANPINENNKNKPLKDEQMANLLQEDLNNYKADTLRALLSWATQNTIGRGRYFWGKEHFKPGWWPQGLEFNLCSEKGNKLSKKILIEILNAYMSHNNISSKSDSVNSTPKKRSRSISPLTPSKRAKLFEEQFYEEDILCTSGDTQDTFFGYKDQPISINTSVVSASEFQHLMPITTQLPKILRQSVRDQCMQNLSSPDTWISDLTINAFSSILKNSIPNLNGLQDTIFSQSLRYMMASKTPNSIQIHYNGSHHWVCSYYNNKQTYLYDSLFRRKTTALLDTQLARLYGEKELNVTVPSLQQQRGTSDCGLFACAVATALAYGQDPSKLTWDQTSMRLHLRQCIDNEYVTQFPTLATKAARTNKVPKPYKFKIKLYCDCNLPECGYNDTSNTNTYMVSCKKCQKWYHNRCYNLDDTSNIKGIFICNT